MDTLTSESGRFDLVIQNDANLVTYDRATGLVVWDSASGIYRPPDLSIPWPPAPVGRRGLVRLDGRAMRDDDGIYLPLGASLFWAVRGARNEPDRLTENLRWLRARDVDFIRVLAETTDWSVETRTDPRWPDYRDALAATVQIAQRAGLRIAWTIFGGNALSDSEQDRCVGDLLSVLATAPETVQYVEISNEDQGHLSTDQYRRYAQQCRAVGFVTALTSVPHAPLGIYQSAPVDVATVHFERDLREHGWRPVRQPWGYPGEYGSGFPATFISGEPIGPGSSVASDTDPERLAMGAVHTYLCGGCAHVVHFGAGIYGVQTSHPVGGDRPSNVWEQVALAETLALIREHRRVLPPDLPNWQRTRHGFADHPWTFPPDPAETVGDKALDRNQGCVRCYAAYRDGRFVAAPVGLMDHLVCGTQQADGMTFYERDGRSRLVVGDYR